MIIISFKLEYAIMSSMCSETVNCLGLFFRMGISSLFRLLLIIFKGNP